VKLEGDKLRLTPRMPKDWKTYKIHYRFRQTIYHITIIQFPADSADTNVLSVDGQAISGDAIPLRDDHDEHFVEMKVHSVQRVPDEFRLAEAIV